MDYVYGQLTDLTKIRTALDKLAGMPFPVMAVPSPPRAATYSEGAIGWMEHVLAPPHDIGGGKGLLAFADDAFPYCGQTYVLDGETITIPTREQLLSREQLPQDAATWLYNFENPPDDIG